MDVPDIGVPVMLAVRSGPIDKCVAAAKRRILKSRNPAFAALHIVNVMEAELLKAAHEWADADAPTDLGQVLPQLVLLREFRKMVKGLSKRKKKW